MAAEGFQYKEFADDLSGQAKAVLPADLSPEDQDYVYNTVKNFCLLSGEALANDTENTYTVDQASIITQIIGEWSFHKSLDIIRGKIPNKYRDSVMQKIAFTIFEVAKQATLKGLPQDQLIGLVEHHVKKAYNDALADLMKRGILSQKQAQNAANQSNIDAMAQADNEALDNSSDLKILKLAAFALIAKNLPKDKVTTLLSKFPQTEANVVLQYMTVDNLQEQIDPSLLTQCLQDLQKVMPKPQTVSVSKLMRNFGKNVKTVPKNFMLSLIADERPLIDKVVFNPAEYETFNISTDLLEVICTYIETKINDYKTKSI